MRKTSLLQGVTCISLGLCVALGGRWYWNIAQHENHPTSSADSVDAKAQIADSVQPASSRPGTPNGIQANQEAHAIRLVREELVNARKSLTSKQMQALKDVAEADQPSVLARFAEGHQQELAEIAALESRLRDRQFNPTAEAPHPQAVAAQIRFADVRQLIKEEGLTLEEAEARVDGLTKQ